MGALVDIESTAPEADLIAAARLGSPSAFADLLRLHQAAVRHYMARFVRNVHTADDLAQEVFLAAYRSIDELQTDRPVLPWLLGIARHQALHFLRTEARRLQRERKRVEAALNGLRLHQLEQSHNEDIEQQLAALRACLEKLPTHGRELVDAFYEQSESAESIGLRLGRTSGSVRMMLLRLRQALAECIRRRLTRSVE
jgi:RNA polymerase sigma-70 factor (ECF subfamily)